MTDSRLDPFSKVERALEAFRKGEMVILVDDQDRENEGDLVFPAEDVSAEKINFMIKEARGLVCLSLAGSYVDRLDLPLMADVRKGVASASSLGTAFTVSIEASTGVSTGISAADRARTIQVAIDDMTRPSDLKVPGHIFPLRAKDGGVLERTGHTEGSVDLARLANKKPAAVICEIMNNDGTMARLPDLQEFGARHGIPLLAIEDLIIYRLARESLVRELKHVCLDEKEGIYGTWFRSELDTSVHFALSKGGPFSSENSVDVRVHKQNPLLDIWSQDVLPATELAGSRWKIEYGLNLVRARKRAVFLYLSYTDKNAMEDLGSSFMDPRIYGVGAQILKKLGIAKMRLHLSSERTLIALRGFGLEIADTVVMSPDRERVF